MLCALYLPIFLVSRPVLKPNNLEQRMAVTQELAGVGEKNFLQWYFQHKNIHGVNLQLNRTNFKSLSTLPLRHAESKSGIFFVLTLLLYRLLATF